MNKIKIKNNSFEIPYIDEEGEDYSREREILNNIIDLFDNYSCFIEYSCEDRVFSDFKILNYIEKHKFRKIIEVEKFKGINNDMFGNRFVDIYFMSEGFNWNDFLKIKYGDIFKKFEIKIILFLDEFGFVNIRYNPIYDEQIKNVIGKENIK